MYHTSEPPVAALSSERATYLDAEVSCQTSEVEKLTFSKVLARNLWQKELKFNNRSLILVRLKFSKGWTRERRGISVGLC